MPIMQPYLMRKDPQGLREVKIEPTVESLVIAQLLDGSQARETVISQVPGDARQILATLTKLTDTGYLVREQNTYRLTKLADGFRISRDLF